MRIVHPTKADILNGVYRYVDLILMTKNSKRSKSNPELARKRMENSLPLSLSRWFAGLWRKKK